MKKKFFEITEIIDMAKENNGNEIKYKSLILIK